MATNQIVDVNAPLARRKALIAKLMQQLTRYQQGQATGTIGGAARAGRAAPSGIRSTLAARGVAGMGQRPQGGAGALQLPPGRLPPIDLSFIPSGFNAGGGDLGVDYGDAGGGDFGGGAIDYGAPDPPPALPPGYMDPGGGLPPANMGTPEQRAADPSGLSTLENMPQRVDPGFTSRTAQTEYTGMDPWMQALIMQNPVARRSYFTGGNQAKYV